MRVRPHDSYTDAVFSFSFFFFSLLPIHFQGSVLISLRTSTQGNAFLYEVKYEISGTELLMHLCTPLQWLFLEDWLVQIV